MTTIIYVLKLAEGKYYVGSTQNIVESYTQHRLGIGCQWTRKYPVHGIIELCDNVEPSQEHNTTKQYMAAHGVDNVRSDFYCHLNIAPEVTALIIEQINSMSCTPYKLPLTNNVDTLSELLLYNTQVTLVQCTRCGRNTHDVVNCRCETHIDGYWLQRLEHCTRCDRVGHLAVNCFTKTNAKGDVLTDNVANDDCVIS